jgi:dihydrolipoamide dehydrogenase
LREAETFGVTGLSYSFDFGAVTARKNAVVEQLRGGVEGLLGHKNITVVHGKASFKDAHTVVVDESEYTADYIIIATGSVSASLPIPGTELPGILTSREILDIQEVPKRLCVIGGGVIGLEFASIFRSFGSEVTVLEYFKEILPRFDSDLSKRLKQSLGKRGIEICTQAQVTGIEILRSAQDDTTYRVSFTRKGKEEVVEADKVLMAVGRKANVDSLNLADVGIEFTPRGIVVDDKTMQTNIPHIYAVGDINGKMMLAHAATFQGLVALDHIMGVENEIDLLVMPAAVFTSPEAACVGMTEEDCKAAEIPVKCLKSFFRANGKAVTMGETDGFCKVIVAAEPKEGCESPYEPGRILGCHLYGPHASDIVQEACALITRKATLKEFESIIHTHPTLSEVLQSAVHG